MHDANSPNPDMQKPNPTRPLAGRRVMVVEDEPLEAIDCCDELRDAGAEIVGPYTSVAEALRHVDDAQIDVALLDYALADQNSEQLQSALERRKIPFVVLTGYPRVLVRRDEDQPVLTKPIPTDQLCMALNAALSGDPPQSTSH